jgi:hypothetical protein
MPIFTAVAAAVSAAVGGGLFGAVAGFAARTLLTVGITKLIADRANKTAPGTGDAGSRVQLPPASNNKVPVVYGKAYMAPIVTDAKISTDQKIMWYVCTLAEVTDTGSYTFGDIYWGGKKVIFDGTDTAKVVQLETNEATPQFDDKVNGKIYIYKFPNGSSSGISGGVTDAISLLSDLSIPADQRWNGSIYTTGGQSPTMDNLAFVVVKVYFDTNAGTQRLDSMSIELTNSLDKPGDALYDYMTNTRYGCAIDSSNVNTDSIDTLNDYSDELIDYIPVGGGTATQARYRINGPVNTGQNCLNNLQELVDACDSWLQYSELTGEWTIVINKPYDWDGTTIGDLYQITGDNLISGINVNPIDLNNAYNQLEVQFPDNIVNDQINFNIINLIQFAPEVMSPNEPENKLVVQFPQVNNYIQATYLGLRRMLQSREDLVIDLTLDYSGIQVQAGDVITVPFEPYAWDVQNSGYGKLFRVSQVQEAKLDDGSLGARIVAFEYNGTIYSDDPIQNYVDSANTGIADPNIISTPNAPTATLNVANTIAQMSVTGTIPTYGQVLYMDFNIGTSSNSANHTTYTTLKQSSGEPYTAGGNVSINVTDVAPGTYYWSVTARNDLGGVRSPSSNSVGWTSGPTVTVYDSGTGAGGVGTTNIKSGAITAAKIAAAAVIASKILDGVVSLSKLAPNTGGYLFKDLYTVFNSAAPQDLPVPAGPGVRNVPITIAGTNPGSSYIWPWYQGTSSSSDGYGTTSTGPYEPYDAALIDLWADSGDYDWYELFYQSFSSNPFATNEYITINVSIQIFSDTADTEIQIAPLPYFTGGVPLIQTQQMQSYTITQADPHVQTISTSYWTPTGTSVEALGFAIRNLTSGSTVTITSCWWSMAQYKS